MSAREHGGPAFPNITPDMNVDGGPGMSLRDYFAAHALSLMASDELRNHVDETYATYSTRRAIASYAYAIADMMLQERAK